MEYKRMDKFTKSLIVLLRTKPQGATCFRRPEQHRTAHSENATEYAPLVCLDELESKAAGVSDDTVALHIVCPPCARMIHAILESLILGFTSGNKTLLSMHTIKSIQESAMRGCHLCSLLLRQNRKLVEYDDPLRASSKMGFRFSYEMNLESCINRKNFQSGLYFFTINPTDSFLEGQFHSRIPKVLSPSHVAGLVDHWVTTCASQHPRCSIDPCLNENRPTRLIDISDLQSLFLVTKTDLETVEKFEYMTLSYQWGKGDFFKLNSDNLAALKAGISYSLIPQTFQDVIYLARNFGFKYIWIDALCILQDSVEDWAYESNRMADVYRHGILNICVCNADANAGCLQSRSPLFWSHCLIADSGDELVMAANDSFMSDINRKDVLKRGWIFQERLLSPRTIYIGDEACMFECASSVSTECAPCWWEPSDRVSKRIFRKLIETAIAVRRYDSGQQSYQDDFQRDDGFGYLNELWEKLVGAYIETSLSFLSDRLPALAAIATSIRNASGFDYVAGHWYELLPISLLWYRSREKLWLAPPRKRFPSWAWTSAEFQDRRLILHEHPHRRNRNGRYEGYMKCAKPLGWQVTPLKDRTAVLGEVEGARLRISGIVTRITNWKLIKEKGKELFEMKFDNGQVLSIANQESTISDIRKVELEDGLGPEAPLTFLTIYTHCQYYDSYIDRLGLILAPYKDGFIRVGLVKLRVEIKNIWRKILPSQEEIEQGNLVWGVGIEQEVSIY